MVKLLGKMGKKGAWLFALLVLLAAIQAFSDLMLPDLMGRIISIIQSAPFYESSIGNLATDVFYTGLIMLAFAILSAAANMGVCYLASNLTMRIVSKARKEVFDKITSFSMTELDQFSTSSLVTRTTNDFSQIQTSFNQAFRFLIYAPLLAICAILMIIRKNLTLTAVTAVAIIILLAFILLIFFIAVPKFNSIQKKTDRVNTVSRENLTGIRVVRALNAEQLEEDKFEVINNDLTKTQRFVNRSTGLIMPFMNLIMGFLSVAIVWVGSYLIQGDTLELPEMTAFTQYATQVLVGFLVVAILFVIMPRAIVCAKRINEILKTENSIKEGKNDNLDGLEVGTVEFKDVSFTYPGAEKPVLDHVSFKAKKGETVAFIGATGSGKTTLINLIPRFYDVTSGEVLVDGRNVKDYRFYDLFDRLGYVPQKGVLFSGSLRFNVCYGKPDASDKEFKEALDIAQASEFVAKLPNQENYQISQGGKNVSGGQRQRLQIARAIVKKPEIYIFDDSFSALDYKTDKVLRAELKNKIKGATSILVAQRIGTILDADQIIVLDEGKMVGHGKHHELMKTCKVYQDIAYSQLSKEELANA